MKTIAALTTLSTALVSSPAFAAAGAREDNSDLVVWIFLAFCALIVIGQMFPMIKNLRAAKPRMEVESKQVKEKA